MTDRTTVSNRNAAFAPMDGGRKAITLINDLLALTLLGWYLLPAFRLVGRSELFALLLGGWLVTSLCLDKNWLARRDLILGMALWGLWYAVLLVNLACGRTLMFPEYTLVMVVFFAPALLFHYYHTTRQFQKLKLFSYCVLLLLICTGATTLAGQFRFPNSARILSTGLTTQPVDMYSSHNIGGYGFSYGLMLYLIVFSRSAMLYRHAAAKLAAIGVLLFFLAVLLKVQFTICIIYALLGVLAALALKKRRLVVLVSVAAAALALALIFYQEILAWLTALSENITSSVYRMRVDDILRLLKSGKLGGDMLLRLNMYTVSLGTIAQHPLLGVGGFYGYDSAVYGVGGHAELFDFWARYGLVGLAPMLALFARHFRLMLAWYRGSRLRTGVVVLLCVFLLLMCTNTLFTSTEIGLILFFALPALRYVDDAGQSSELVALPAPSAPSK